MGPENGVPPSQIRIFQDGDAVYLLRLTTKRLYVARWNGENAFEEIVMNELQGIDYPIASFDCIRRNKRDLELAILCHDGQSYRPETFKGRPAVLLRRSRDLSGCPARLGVVPYDDRRRNVAAD